MQQIFWNVLYITVINDTHRFRSIISWNLPYLILSYLMMIFQCFRQPLWPPPLTLKVRFHVSCRTCWVMLYAKHQLHSSNSFQEKSNVKVHFRCFPLFFKSKGHIMTLTFHLKHWGLLTLCSWVIAIVDQCRRYATHLT